MEMSARLRILVVALAALGCFAFVAAPSSAAKPGGVAAAREEFVRAERGPVRVWAVVRNGSKMQVLRGQSSAAGAAALEHRLRAMPDVVSAEVDGVVHAATAPNDPSFDQQWAFNAVDYQSAWTTTTGTGITVAVLDTGVRADHEDLVGNVDNGADCLNATTSSNCVTTAGSGDTDPNGHGTHVAGIIAAHANNGLGISGAAPGAHILPVRVLDATGSGYDSGIAAAIMWATDRGAKVISMSLTGDAASIGLQAAVNYALSHNVIIVAAAGNNKQSGNAVQYPAAYSGVVSVGSIKNTSPYSRSAFSNTSSNVALMAPGESILSTYDTSTSAYQSMSGTSMATPYVAASAALLLAAGMQPANVVTELESTAVPIAGSTGLGSASGFGIVNPAGALVQLESSTTTTSSSATTTTTITGESSTTTTTTAASTTTTITLAPTTTTRPTTTTTLPKAVPNTKPAVETGYWIVSRDGRVRGFGHPTYGDRYGKSKTPIVALAATPTGKGYWLAGSDGAVYAFGNAKSYGSLAGKRLNSPIVAMASTPSGAGYWMMGADGGIFGYGDARFYGSTGSKKLTAPVLDLAPTPTGKGYWLVATDGGVFGFGDAVFYGSAGSVHLAKPVVSMSPNRAGKGYWLIASDSGVFGYGGVKFYGNLLSLGVHKTTVRLRATRTGAGYWILASDGSVYAFGDAKGHGWRATSGAVDIAVQ
jgi:subtilisin family serine protease